MTNLKNTLIFLSVACGMFVILTMAGRPIHVAPIEALVAAIAIYLGGYVCRVPALWRWLRQERLVARLTADVESLSAANHSLRQEHDIMEEEILSARGNARVIRDRLRDRNEKYQHARDEIECLTRQLAAQKAQVTKLRRRLGLPVKRGAK